MQKDAKIFVAGHRGLAGSAIVRKLRSLGYENLLLRTRQEVDLQDANAVSGFFAEQRPEFVFLAAAKVGGILANRDFPADFIAQNLRIQSNVIESAYRAQSQAAAVPRIELHLSQAGAAADPRRSTAGRAAGVHQPLLCGGKDCRHRDVLGLQPAARNPVSGGDADQSLRAGRQLRSGKFARSARADSQSA